MTRHGAATRTASLMLTAFALASCASTHHSGTSSANAPPSPTPHTSPMPDTSSRPLLVPTMTSPPDTVEGPITKPVPAGVTAVTVSFLHPGGSGPVVYRTTVTSPNDVRTLVDAIDALHVTGGETKGCSMSPVDLRLDFAGPGHASSFVEDSSCRYATLTIDGSPGPKLDSAELGVAEETVRETAVTGPDGQLSISAAPPPSAG